MTAETNTIIECVLAGDLDQYREIVRQFEADVFRIAAPILGSRIAAEDVTQEVFITAYRRLDNFDLRKPFRPWLLGIARNHVRNELRRRTRNAARLELYSYYLQAETSSATATSSDSLADALADCRQGLSPVAAQAIRSRYEEGLSLEAIADSLQRSLTATRQLLYRTRIVLRDCIEAQMATAGSDP